MAVQNFPSGFPEGVFIRGIPFMQPFTGKAFWVGNSATLPSGELTAANTNDGESNRPFATIDFAIGQCAANRGDIIIVRPNHVETVTAAAGLALDVAGVAIIGIGRGANRPTVNFTTVVGASMVVSAAACSMFNFLFTGGIDALTNPVHIQAADFLLSHCETRDVTGQATDFIVTTAAADRLEINNWVHRGAAVAGADTALSIVGGDGIKIQDFWVDGDFAVAAIENVTTASTMLTIGGKDGPCYARTRNVADAIITCVAADTTGFIGPNIYARLQENAANIGAAFVGTGMVFMPPLGIVNLINESAHAASTAVTGVVQDLHVQSTNA